MKYSGLAILVLLAILQISLCEQAHPKVIPQKTTQRKSTEITKKTKPTATTHKAKRSGELYYNGALNIQGYSPVHRHVVVSHHDAFHHHNAHAHIAHAHAHIVHPHAHIAHPHAHILHRHAHIGHHLHTHVHHGNHIHQLFHNSAKGYINVAKLAYCKKQFILAKTCSICPSVLGAYKTFFIHSVNQKKIRLFQFVVLYSDAKKEVLISFSGPKTNQPKFFNKTYAKGFKKVKELGGVKIEKFYWQIYSKYMRKVLHKKLKKVIKSKRGNYKFTFVGHSFGGSFATLAAYDLVKNNVLKANKKLNSPIVYTYGLMRIGDAKFVQKVNKLFKVVRIIRNDDFATRAPSCVYDTTSLRFRCYRRVSKVIRHYPLFRRYFITYRRGLRYYRRSIARRVPAAAQRRSVHVAARHHHHVAAARPVNRAHHYLHAYYSQPLGTIISYNGNNFSTYSVCNFVNGIPVCEKKVRLPHAFSATAHVHYFSTNVEAC